MARHTNCVGAGACALVAGVTLAIVSQAGVTETLKLEVTNDAGTGLFEVIYTDGYWEPQTQTWTWELERPTDILASGTQAHVARLLGAVVVIEGSARKVRLSFNLLAGDSDTQVVATTPTLTFATILADEAEASATATVSLTDMGGFGGQAWIWGLGPPGTGIFRAQYAHATEDFTHLVAYMSVNNGGTVSGTQHDPLFGTRPVGSDIADMRTFIGFTVSAHDLVSTTSVYDVDGDAAPRNVTFGTPHSSVKGDMDCNFAVDALDIDPFFLALGDANLYQAAHPDCEVLNGDMNGDGGLDAADVDPFFLCVGFSVCP